MQIFVKPPDITQSSAITTELFKHVQSYVLPLFVIIPREGITDASLIDETFYQLGFCTKDDHLFDESGETTPHDGLIPFITLEGLFHSLDSVSFFIGHITHALLNAQLKSTDYPLRFFTLIEGGFSRFILKAGDFDETTDESKNVQSFSALHTIKTFYQQHPGSDVIDSSNDEEKTKRERRKERRRRKEERRRDFFQNEFFYSIALLESSIQKAAHTFQFAKPSILL